MTDTPPDWALIEAAKRFGWDRGRPISALQKDYEVSVPFRAFCDMILKHEQSPVDRKLLCAREASRKCASEYSAAVRAIELWEEGFGK
jgi:hypothetical protein